MSNTISKKAYKDIGDSVGMPDETDKQNIQKIILRYEQKHPGEIKDLIDYARKNSTAFDNEYGLTTGKKKYVGGSSIRYLMELPRELHQQIEEYIPTIFRSKKHFAWFCKNFKNLLIARKY